MALWRNGPMVPPAPDVTRWRFKRLEGPQQSWRGYPPALSQAQIDWHAVMMGWGLFPTKGDRWCGSRKECSITGGAADHGPTRTTRAKSNHIQQSLRGFAAAKLIIAMRALSDY